MNNDEKKKKSCHNSHMCLIGFFDSHTSVSFFLSLSLFNLLMSLYFFLSFFGSRLKRLHQLVRSAREEGVRDEDGITTAEELIRATEAEVHLSGVSSLVEAIECASSANVSEIKRLDDALATAKTHGSHPGRLDCCLDCLDCLDCCLFSCCWWLFGGFVDSWFGGCLVVVVVWSVCTSRGN